MLDLKRKTDVSFFSRKEGLFWEIKGWENKTSSQPNYFVENLHFNMQKLIIIIIINKQ